MSKKQIAAPSHRPEKTVSQSVSQSGRRCVHTLASKTIYTPACGRNSLCETRGEESATEKFPDASLAALQARFSFLVQCRNRLAEIVKDKGWVSSALSERT